MKVVFLEEVEGTASPGDVKNVADGFARNYLLPRKLAAPANDHYISIANAKATKHAKRQDRLDDEARTQLLPRVDGTSISIEVRVGEQEKLFGSVGSRDIAEKLSEATGVPIQHQQVLLGQAIREVGAEEVKVRLTKNVIATVTVNVEALGGTEEEAAGEAPAGAGAKLEDSLVTDDAAASDAQDADKRRQAEEGPQDNSSDVPQAAADVAAPDEEELENTGEPG